MAVADRDAFERRVEECSLNAWPALQQVLFDGWILRFADGYTKRANSVNPIYPSKLDLEAKVSACERIYCDRGLRPIFRLTSFAAPQGLDAALDARGYQVIDPTRVLCLALRDRHWAVAACPDLVDEELDDWMSVFWAISGHDPASRSTHRRMLNSIVGARRLIILRDGGEPVACGLGVLEDEFLGLYDIVVSSQHRRRGHGTSLLRGLIKWASDRGAESAYLQVMESNEAARCLYAGLGFRGLYRYWYRVPRE